MRLAGPDGMERTFSVSVDVDALHHYLAIHGLTRGSITASDPVWRVGVPRLRRLFAELAIRATFFVVASDLVPGPEGSGAEPEECAQRRALLRTLLHDGHTLGSHSFAHDYALSRWSRAEIRADLARATEVLGEFVSPPLGFRAPGYCLSRSLISELLTAEALYSSSRLPSPPYFAAKYAALLTGRLRHRRSASIAGDICAPLTRVGPYRHPGGLLELPIGTIPGVRLPLVGTFLTLYGERGRRWLLPACLRRAWIHLELHGIDLLGLVDVAGTPAESLPQPDLARDVPGKEALFRAWLAELARRRRVSTLEELARQMNLAPNATGARMA